MAALVGIGAPNRVPNVPYLKAFLKSDAVPLKGWIVARNSSGLWITATTASGLLPGGYSTKNITTAAGADDTDELNVETGIFSVPMVSGQEFEADDGPAPVYFYNNKELAQSGASVAGLFLCLDPRGGYEGNAIVDMGPEGVAVAKALALCAAQSKSGAVVAQEWTAPSATSTTALKTATAMTTDPQTILAAALTSSGGTAALAAYPRNVTFTGGGTTAHCPTQVVITGTDIDDNSLSETLALTAGSGTGVKAFKTIVSFVFTGATSTDSTVACGIGSKLGLSASILVAANKAQVMSETYDSSGSSGSFVDPSTATIVDAATSPPHGTATPANAPNGTRGYALVYVQDLS